jgi:hypothetical protein
MKKAGVYGGRYRISSFLPDKQHSKRSLFQERQDHQA